jgi:hypothetical protein
LSWHIPTLADVLEARRNISGANWGVTTDVSDMSAKTATWTFTSGASATLTLYGTKVWLYAAKAFDQATLSLSLDSSTAATIDNYPAARDAAALTWEPAIAHLGGAHVDDHQHRHQERRQCSTTCADHARFN